MYVHDLEPATIVHAAAHIRRKLVKISFSRARAAAEVHVDTGANAIISTLTKLHGGLVIMTAREREEDDDEIWFSS